MKVKRDVSIYVRRNMYENKNGEEKTETKIN